MARNNLMTELCDYLAGSAMQDRDKVWVYLFNASNDVNGVRFAFVKDSTLMERMGWRSLDRIDAAYEELARTGHARRGNGPNPFKKGTQGAGYFLYPRGDAPAAAAEPQPANEPAAPAPCPADLFGVAKFEPDSDPEGEAPAEAPDTMTLVYDAIRKLQRTVQGVLHVDDAAALIRTDASLRHVPPEEVDFRLQRDLYDSMGWNIREYGSDRFLVQGSLMGEDVPTIVEFNKLADRALRNRLAA